MPSSPPLRNKPYPPPKDTDTNYYHGTHTMGTMAGACGIGVTNGLPKWIACVACLPNGCSYSNIIKCMEFVACPYKKFPANTCGTTTDCSVGATDVVSNSYGGGSGDTSFNTAIDNMKAMGITVVFAAGNSGPNCGSVNSPGDQPNVVACGAYDLNKLWQVLAAEGQR
jgi:subtilisin family serine protease